MAEEQDPWGNKKDNRPKNIDEWVEQGLKKFTEAIKKGTEEGKQFKAGGKSGPPNKSRLLGYFAIFILAIVAYMSVFQIQPGEAGVILRFGKHVRTAPSGLNFIIPFVENVTKVDIETVRSVEFVNRNLESISNYDNVASMVTADRNVINVNWVVQYRIKNPENYLFNIQNVSNTIKDFSEYVVRRNAGNRDFDYILNQREELAFSSYTEIQSLLDKYNSGVELVTLQLLDVTPPEKVRPAFNEVNEADQDKTRLVNEAQKEVNEKVPRARGDAQKSILESEGYAIKVVNEAQGDADRFLSVYNQYRNYRSVTRSKLYVETLSEVLPNLSEVIVLDKAGNQIPFLNLTNPK